MRLGYVNLLAPDPAKTAAWYVEYLGLSVIVKTDDFVLLDAGGGAHLGFHRGAASSRAGDMNINFEVPDVDQAHDNLRARGIAFQLPPRNMPWGYRMAAMTDPAGYSVKIYTSLLGDDVHGA